MKQSVINASSRLLRLIFIGLTFGFLAFALFQSLGRVAMALLDRAEGALNAQLAPRQVRLEGLRGRWRLMNPVVEVAAVHLPGGALREITAELDWFESLARRRWIFSHLTLEHFDLTLVPGPAGGWGLPGLSGEGAQVDWAATLNHSDALELAGSLLFKRPDSVPEPLTVRLRAWNRGGQHRLALDLGAAGCDARCPVRFRQSRADALWPLRPALHQLQLQAEAFVVPRALTPGINVNLERLTLAGGWRGDDGGLTLNAGVTALSTAPDGLERSIRADLNGRAGATATGLDGLVEGRLTIDEGAPDELPAIWLRAEPGGLRFAMPTLDIAVMSDLLGRLLPGDSPGARWLRGLAPTGTASGLRGRWQPADALLAFTGQLDGVTLRPFKGVPGVTGAGGRVVGYEQGLTMLVRGSDMDIEFPELFAHRWNARRASGRVELRFNGGALGLTGSDVVAEVTDSSASGAAEAAETVALSGAFCLYRPPMANQGQIGVQATVAETSLEFARTLMPSKLPAGLTDWLETAPVAGTLHNARFAIQAELGLPTPPRSRRAALLADLRGGQVRFHPAWPEVRDLDAHLVLSGSDVYVAAQAGISSGADLAGSEVAVLDEGGVADIRLRAHSDLGDALSFVRQSPLADSLTFVDPSWAGSGPVQARGRLRVPLTSATAARSSGDLDFELGGVSAELANYRLPLRKLEGRVRYVLPEQVAAEGITGTFHGGPFTLSAATADRAIQLAFDGRTTPDALFELLDLDDPGIARGELDYRGRLTLPLAGAANRTAAVPQLWAQTDLAGLSMDLFAPLGKSAEELRPTEIQVAFDTDAERVRFHHGALQGHLQIDEAVAGVVGIGSEPPRLLPAQGELRVGGGIAQLDVGELTEGEGAGFPLRLLFEDFRVDRLLIADQPFADLFVSGAVDGASFDLRLAGPDMLGNVAMGADGLLRVDLDLLQLPALAAAAEGVESPADPLSPEMVQDLPPVDFSVALLKMGGTDYGSWDFRFRRRSGQVFLEDLVADFRGVSIRSTSQTVWDLAADQTHFVGLVSVADLAEVLPAFGYAPSLTTRRGVLDGDLRWRGSPLNFELANVIGAAAIEAEDGRFLEVEAGNNALRIFSLLNFTAIAKRMALDFSDVFGRGVSFDELETRVAFDRGLIRFLEPLVAEGTGSKFRVGGQVNMNTGVLDNEMIVTLPVTKGLPWYAAYVALANPLAGVGMLVGERVLRKPLEQFSSAKYHVSGTLDEPSVKFISIFDTRMQAPPEADGQIDGETEDLPAPADDRVAPATGSR